MKSYPFLLLYSYVPSLTVVFFHASVSIPAHPYPSATTSPFLFLPAPLASVMLIYLFLFPSAANPPPLSSPSHARGRWTPAVTRRRKTGGCAPQHHGRCCTSQREFHLFLSSLFSAPMLPVSFIYWFRLPSDPDRRQLKLEDSAGEAMHVR